MMMVKTFAGGVMASFSLVWGAVMLAQAEGSGIPDAILGIGGIGIATLIIGWMIRASTKVEGTYLSGIEVARAEAKAATERAERAEARAALLLEENDRLRGR